MTGTARHNEVVRLAQTPPKRQDDRVAPPANARRRRTNVTWIVAACACLTAFAVKLSQQWLIWADETGVYRDLATTFDWAAILLAICAVALFAVQIAPADLTNERSTAPTGLTVSPPPLQRTNLALPASDDSRLRLAQSLSHELRTPLNAVIGFSDLMNHQLHGNLGHPKYNEYCAHISASSQSLLRAVDDILALNGSLGHDLQNRVPVAVADALRQAWDENKVPDVADLKISGDENPRVMADPDLLSHALANVVDTLKRHSTAGSTISAVIRYEENKTRLYLTAILDESQVVETAPLAELPGEQPQSQRASRDTLTEAAAEALVQRMSGDLVIRQPAGTRILEVICDLPAPDNENTPPYADRSVA